MPLGLPATPDPYPAGPPPVTIQPYIIDVPAQRKGRPYDYIPGRWYRCLVHVDGTRRCWLMPTTLL
jgi:hypothetical protein